MPRHQEREELPADSAGRRRLDDGGRVGARARGLLPAPNVITRWHLAIRRLVQGLLPIMTITSQVSSSTGSSRADAFIDRVASREAVVGVIGLGYVGLPLVLLYE